MFKPVFKTALNPEFNPASRQFLQQSSRTLLASALALSLPAARAENGVTSDTVVLGQSTSLTGPLAELGIDTSTASKAYFDYVNAQGGVNGRKIQLISVDDAYNTERALANVKSLVEKDNVFALFNVLGTPSNIALLPILEKYNIPHVAPYSGSIAMRKPHNRLVFNVRASYHDEAEQIVDHLGVRGITKVGIVSQNNPFGKDGYDGVVNSLAKRKQKLHVQATIESDSSDAAKAAATLAAGQPQAIIMITAGKPSVEFIKAYNKLAVGMQFFALSVMGTQTSVNALGKEGVGVVVSQAAPFPFTITSGIVKEYQHVMNKMGVKNRSFISMEGFINAKVAVEGLRRAGRELTREHFINGLESIGKWDMDGYLVNLTKNDHLGSRYVELTVISKDGRFLR